MLTPTIVSHWSDGKRIHVIGFFGGHEGDTYLRSEDTNNKGTIIKWGPEIKSAKPPILFIGGSAALNVISPNPDFGVVNGNLVLYRQRDGIEYVKITSLIGAELADGTDLSDAAENPFYAIFHKFV